MRPLLQVAVSMAPQQLLGCPPTIAGVRQRLGLVSVQDCALVRLRGLLARHDLFLKARDLHPARWSGATRNWSPVGPVTLNPERNSIVAAYAEESTKQPLAA